MTKARIPVIPGSVGAVDNEESATRIVKEIGFPVLIKAAGGGGGKGMRVVRDEKDLMSSMKQAMNEARSTFGNPTIFIEKFLEAPRHIEFQILADNHGNVVHLFERECSVQRRHQKLIEEAPSAIMTARLRSKMGDAADDARFQEEEIELMWSLHCHDILKCLPDCPYCEFEREKRYEKNTK